MASFCCVGIYNIHIIGYGSVMIIKPLIMLDIAAPLNIGKYLYHLRGSPPNAVQIWEIGIHSNNVAKKKETPQIAVMAPIIKTR